MSDTNERLERQMEGTNLALAAVAEVLQKMDDRLNKAEEQEYIMEQSQQEQYEMQNAQVEKAQLVKAIAGEVIDVMKAGVGESKQGMEVDGSASRKAKASTGSGGTVTGGGNDDAKAAPTPQGTKSVGQAIEAMQKQLRLIKEGYGMAKDEFPPEDEYPAEEAEDEDSEEVPEEEEEVEEGYGFERAIQNLQKQMNDFQNTMGKKIVTESERRLAKMGFKEETSLQRPNLIHYDDEYGNPLGIDGTTPVSKASEVDVVDQLTDMSYKQLRELQFKVESGDTDGIPQELLG